MLQALQERAGSGKQGFQMGVGVLTEGFSSGVSGLVQQPVRGAMSGGAEGFVRGVGRGLVGAVTKPISGVAGFASKWTEGIASDAKKLTPDAQRKLTTARLLRVRQPRQLTAEGVLRSYARTPSLVLDS